MSHPPRCSDDATAPPPAEAEAGLEALQLNAATAPPADSRPKEAGPAAAPPPASAAPPANKVPRRPLAAVVNGNRGATSGLAQAR